MLYSNREGDLVHEVADKSYALSYFWFEEEGVKTKVLKM